MTTKNSTVGIATRLDSPEFESRQEKEIFSSEEPSIPSLRPISLPTECVPGLFLGGRAAGTGRWPLNLEPRLRMSAALTLLPYVPSWCGHGQPYLIKEQMALWRDELGDGPGYLSETALRYIIHTKNGGTVTCDSGSNTRHSIQVLNLYSIADTVRDIPCIIAYLKSRSF